MTPKRLTHPPAERGELRPLVLLSNSGRKEANVRLQAFYTLEGESHEQVLYDTSVAAGAVAHVDLNSQVERLPQDAENIGLKIAESGKRRGILADVLLVDSTGSQVLQLFPKGYAGEVHPSHGFPFRIDGSTNTIVTVAKPITAIRIPITTGAAAWECLMFHCEFSSATSAQ